MRVIIADTLPASIAKLDPQSQARVKQAVFDFQVDPKNPGFRLHRVEKTKDKGFWSIRVSRDLRVIVHRSGDATVMCYADHHDPAYRWAEMRRLETHADTGAAQMIVIDERVEEVVKRVVREVEEEQPLFGTYADDYLLALGVPREFLDATKHVGQSSLLDLCELLPDEAAERLFDLAGGKPVPRPARTDESPFEHPDAQRRFVIVASGEELRRALESRWERWTVFLHPSQRSAVEKRYSGPALVSGGAGTGKTVVALHRAAHLARNGRGRVLLTTFSATLAHRLVQHMGNLLPEDDEARQRVTIQHLHKVARDLWVKFSNRNLKVADDRATIERHLAQADHATGDSGFDLSFLRAGGTLEGCGNRKRRCVASSLTKA